MSQLDRIERALELLLQGMMSDPERVEPPPPEWGEALRVIVVGRHSDETRRMARAMMANEPDNTPRHAPGRINFAVTADTSEMMQRLEEASARMVELGLIDPEPPEGSVDDDGEPPKE